MIVIRKKINKCLLATSTAPSIQNLDDHVSYLFIAKASGEELTFENHKASLLIQLTLLVINNRE